MGGHSYGGRNKYKESSRWWQTGFFLSLISGFLFFITFTIFYDVGLVNITSKGEETIQLGLSETRLIPISSIWTSHIGGGVVTQTDLTPRNENEDNSKVDYEGKLIRLLKFSEMPSLSGLDSWHSYIYPNIAPQDYYCRYFYKGSRLSIEWTFYSDADGEMVPTIGYLVRSQSGFDEFKQWLKSSHLETPFRKPIQYIVAESTSTQIFFDVTEDDYYNVCFLNRRKESLYGYFEYTVDAKMFDLRNPKASCYLPCILPVKRGEYLFYVSPLAGSFASKSNSYNTYFEFSQLYIINWQLVVLVLISPLGTYLLLLTAWFILKKSRKKKRKGPSSCA